MTRVALTWHYPVPVDYYDTQLATGFHMHEAVRLLNHFLYLTPGDGIFEEDEIADFLEEDPDANQVWLLYRLERKFVPRKKFFPAGNPLGHLFSSRYMTSRGWHQVYDALLMLRADLVNDGLTIFAEAFCRDPWSDPAPTAYWLDLRLRQASEAYGGANELTIFATERDTPLQGELKKLGYFCYHQDPDTGDLTFSKLLEPRSRESVLGSFSPTIPQPKQPSKAKRRKRKE